MPSRRLVLVAAVALLVAPGIPSGHAQTDTPEAFLTAIYTRVTAGDGTAGGAAFSGEKARSRYFVKDLAKVWDEADAEAEKSGEIGPIEFDPFTDSQDPQVRRFDLRGLEATAETAKLRVSLFRDRKPKAGEKPQTVLDFTLKREAGGWRIADIARRGGEMPWTLIEIFAPLR
mgnify:FL=1